MDHMLKKRIVKIVCLLCVLFLLAGGFHYFTKTQMMGTYSTEEFEITNTDGQYYIVLDERQLKIVNKMLKRVTMRKGSYTKLRIRMATSIKQVVKWNGLNGMENSLLYSR